MTLLWWDAAEGSYFLAPMGLYPELDAFVRATTPSAAESNGVVFTLRAVPLAATAMASAAAGSSRQRLLAVELRGVAQGDVNRHGEHADGLRWFLPDRRAEFCGRRDSRRDCAAAPGCR
jgi:hypothetical protein